MKGILTKHEDGDWRVKWSDLHSFEQGSHWVYSKISEDSTLLQIIKDDKIEYMPFSEGKEVDFEIIYEETTYLPSIYVKLIFPEVDEFKKQKLINQYVIEKKELFSIDRISQIRDGETLMLIKLSPKTNPIYINQNDWTIHSSYPTSEENLIKDKPTIAYFFDRLDKYKKGCEFNLKKINNIITELNKTDY